MEFNMLAFLEENAHDIQNIQLNEFIVTLNTLRHLAQTYRGLYRK